MRAWLSCAVTIAAVIAGPLGSTGCVSPELDEQGWFSCPPDKPACPDGHVCLGGRCTPIDAGPDRGPDLDATSDGPLVTLDGPLVTPDGPLVTPDGPLVTPDGPLVTPDGPP